MQHSGEKLIYMCCVFSARHVYVCFCLFLYYFKSGKVKVKLIDQNVHIKSNVLFYHLNVLLRQEFTY